MVIDSSALLAILLTEPEAEGIAAAIERNTPRLLSAANLLEASIVIEARKGEAGGANSTCCRIVGISKSSLSIAIRPRLPGRRGDASAKAAIRRH